MQRGKDVEISELVHNVEMNLIEVKGQLEENGEDHPLFKEAVRQLSESVSLLEEITEEKGR